LHLHQSWYSGVALREREQVTIGLKIIP